MITLVPAQIAPLGGSTTQIGTTSKNKSSAKTPSCKPKKKSPHR